MTSYTPSQRKAFVKSGSALGVTMILTLALSLIIIGVLQLAVFNSNTVTSVESITENSKSAATLLEFSAAQLATKLSSTADFVNQPPSLIAKNFKFLPASDLFVGGQTAIGQGKVDVNRTICDVCKWPDSSPVQLSSAVTDVFTIKNGPTDILGRRLNVVNNEYNFKDPIVSASYSNSAYIPLRCRIGGLPDSKGRTHDVYATAVLWMREANLFRHSLYLNEMIYYIGTGSALSWDGSVFSNKPLIFNLNAGSPATAGNTGTFQIERLACPQFFITNPGSYISYATSAGWNSTKSDFNSPATDAVTLNNKINSNTQAAWMGRGDLNGDGLWAPFSKGATTKTIVKGSLLNYDTTEARPLYVTKLDSPDPTDTPDTDNFWIPQTGLLRANGKSGANGFITLDSSNPDYLRSYASKFNGVFATNESGFAPSLPDGIPPTAAPLARALIEPPSSASPAMPELPRPDGKTGSAIADPLDPTSRPKNPALYDQWSAYLSLSGTAGSYSANQTDLKMTEDMKYGNKASLYVYVDTEGTAVTFAPGGAYSTAAQAAAAYKSSSDKTKWIEKNPSSVLVLPADVISTTNVFLDDTQINRGKNGTSYNGAATNNLNSSNNKLSTSNGDVSSLMDQARLVRAVDVNFGALRTAVRKSGAIVNKGGSTWKPTDANWSGVMYVDVANPLAATTATSTWGQSLDRVKTAVSYTTPVMNPDGTPAKNPDGTPVTATNTGITYTGANLDTAINSVMHQTAVRIYNATKIPDVVGINDSTTPGFTLATNAAAYSVGSVNADTDPNTYPKSTSTTTGATENNNSKDASDATIPDSSSYHVPFGLVCDAYTWMSPAYQGNLNARSISHSSEGYTIPAKAISLDANLNNFATMTSTTDAQGLAFGDINTILAMELSGTAYATPGTKASSISAIKNAEGKTIFATASNVEINMAVITGGGDAQTSTAIHAEPIHVFSLDNNATSTVIKFNGSQVGLFKSQYRPRYNRDARSANYTGSNDAYRYDPNFAKGYVPPGALFTRSYRLTGFRIISRAEYDAMAL